VKFADEWDGRIRNRKSPERAGAFRFNARISATSGRGESARVWRRLWLGHGVGGARVGIAVPELVAQRSAVYFSSVVVFGGIGHRHCQCSD
jgi:hypothetical protein